jgi:tetratricopeptide (TPR) repeat protein
MVDSQEQRVTNRAAKVPDGFLRRLKEDIAFRRIDDGIQLLREHQRFIDSCGPKQKNGGVFLGKLAQWVDIGFANLELIKKLLAKFPEAPRATLTLRDFVHLQMAAGFVDLCDQEDDKAIRHFELVLAIENEVQDLDLITIANFWIGRCYRRQGRYHDALSYVVNARKAATKSKHFKTVAVIQVLEGWILYQEGRLSEGAKTLSEAEDVLFETDDYVARGNLNSVYGRINRRSGNYDQALQRFDAAIQEYKKRDEQYRNVARCLVNIAFVKRLLALELSDKIDREAARIRKAREKQSSGSFNAQHERTRVRALRAEAFRNLIDAGVIYSRHHDHSGSGNVEVSYGYLQLDDGDLDLASSRGEAAYRIGEDKKDTVLKARARILQSAIEYAKVEEQIVESANPRESSRLASEYAHEAAELAKETQSRPLIAQSYVTLGLALLNDRDFEAARNCHNQATNFLKGGTRDYVWRQLQTLKNKLARVGTIEPVLREWSRGVVGNKTFQQVTEDFAAIVIPKVWQREGCKISRVAAQLSISPKKVRRILRSQGYLTESD